MLGHPSASADWTRVLHCTMFVKIYPLTIATKQMLNTIIEELKVRGGQEQLLMFLSGSAEAGKSSAVKVARCFFLTFAVQSVCHGVNLRVYLQHILEHRIWRLME